jgi:uncharacterized membrane protein
MKPSRIALALAWMGPFAVLGWTALHVRQNWSKMPERYPTHWGFNGPDEWQTSTMRNVDATLFFGAGICVFIAITALLAYKSASKATPAHLVIPIGAAFLCAVASAMSPLSAMYPINVGYVILPMAAALVIVSIAVGLISARVAGPNAAMQEGWKGTLIYYNPSNPSLVVENWTGLGWTLNFAHPGAWAILVAALVLPLGVILLMR